MRAINKNINKHGWINLTSIVIVTGMEVENECNQSDNDEQIAIVNGPAGVW